jgi:hypothetical protein
MQQTKLIEKLRGIEELWRKLGFDPERVISVAMGLPGRN